MTRVAPAGPGQRSGAGDGPQGGLRPVGADDDRAVGFAVSLTARDSM